LLARPKASRLRPRPSSAKANAPAEQANRPAVPGRLFVAVRAAEMKLEPRQITVRDQRSRWGSASRRGTVSFSRRLVLSPPDILDYVVVHELAHLRWAGHGARFWALVHRHAPGADHYRRWLWTNEPRLRHALDSNSARFRG
jgi:hypothetical protein